MRSELKKRLNYILPDAVKMLFSETIRKKLINNKDFISQYNMLLEWDNIEDDSSYNDYQIMQLSKVLIHAYEHTKYYKKIFDENDFNPYDVQSIESLKKLPLLSKQTIIDNLDDMIADDADDFYMVTTSGSTGRPLRMYLDGSSIYKEMAFVYHFWSKYGYDYTKSRMATFRGIDFDKKISKVNPLYNEIILNPFTISDKNIDEYVKRILKFNAEFLRGYPSAIANFCRLVKKHGIDISFKAVFCISETLGEDWINIIKNTLRCQAVAFYGHSERSVFAEQQCDKAVYKFNRLYGIAEIIDNPAGNIVCTGFLSKSVPLIRYAVDDIAVEVKEGIYEIIGHHTGEVIYGKNGERITQTALNCQNYAFDKVTAYQYYQEKLGEVTLLVTSDTILNAEELQNLSDAMEIKTKGYIIWSAKQVETLELTKRGKHRWIIQKINSLE